MSFVFYSVLLVLVAAVVIAVGVHLYMLPAIIAYDRRHPQRQAILVLNLLLGWSCLGWLAAMVWAWTHAQSAQRDLFA